MISEFPLFVFTTLVGIAAGAYLLAAVFERVDVGDRRSWAFPLVCLVLIALGGLGVLGHLGRPERVLNALSNPSSMITEEAYWVALFGVVVLIDGILRFSKKNPPRMLRIVGAAFSFVLMCMMGNLYASSYGVPVWNGVCTIPLFVFGDIAMGAGMLALFDRELPRGRAFAWTVAAVDVLALISIVGTAMVFAAAGHGVAPFVVSSVLLAMACVFSLAEGLGKPAALAEALGSRAGAIVVFVLVLAAIAIARYSFYAASIL